MELLPSYRQWSAGVAFSAFDPATDKPAAATYTTCHIYVPFAHRLLAASVSDTDVDKTGTITVSLYQADSTDAKAGTLVGTAITPAATVDVVTARNFTLAAADKVEISAGRLYFLNVVGTNAADRFEQPSLTILVQPLETATQKRSRL